MNGAFTNIVVYNRALTIEEAKAKANSRVSQTKELLINPNYFVTSFKDFFEWCSDHFVSVGIDLPKNTIKDILEFMFKRYREEGSVETGAAFLNWAKDIERDLELISILNKVKTEIKTDILYNKLGHSLDFVEEILKNELKTLKSVYKIPSIKDICVLNDYDVVVISEKKTRCKEETR